jgi:MFS family permease
MVPIRFESSALVVDPCMGYNAAGHDARQLQARVGGPARHVRQHVSLLGVGLATFGPSIGTFALGPLMDRIERRTTLVLFALMMLGSATGFIALPCAVLLVSVLLVWTGPPGSMRKALG